MNLPGKWRWWLLSAITCGGLVILPTQVLAHQYIFALSQRQQTCTALGATGVPAYVVVAGGSRRGFYITGMAAGACRQMGLRPGDLLISVASHIIADAASADSAVRSAAGTPAEVVFARCDDGPPEMMRVQVNLNVPASSAASSPSAASHAAKTTTTTTTAESIAKLESFGADVVNRDRQRNGLNALSVNAALTELARSYAQYLIDNNMFAHVDKQGRGPMDRAMERGIKVNIAENLAFQPYFNGVTERELVSNAEGQMMSEPPNQPNHRGNILGAAHCCMGIGIARNDQRLIMVQEFTDTAP